MTTLLWSNNATGTLNGAIDNVITTATLSTGQGALFPNPTAGQAFLITITDAATQTINEICLCTARSGDVLTIVRDQESSGAKAWAGGAIVSNLITAGSLAAFNQQANGRTRLVANTTVYVSTTGSDSTGDGSVGNPWATTQFAVDFCQKNYDLAGFNLEISHANGTYTAVVIVSGAFVGAKDSSSVQLTGNTTTPTSCIISTTGNTISGAGLAQFSVRGFRLISASGNAINAQRGSRINVNGNMSYGACGGAHVSSSDTGSSVVISANYSANGGAINHLVCGVGGSSIIVSSGVTATISGTPAFTNFARSSRTGNLNTQGATFTGAATGQRYLVDLNAIIDTFGGGANFFPGNAVGAFATGGQYA